MVKNLASQLAYLIDDPFDISSDLRLYQDFY
jgi:hypothetical protein